MAQEEEEQKLLRDELEDHRESTEEEDEKEIVDKRKCLGWLLGMDFVIINNLLIVSMIEYFRCNVSSSYYGVW